MYCIRFDNLEFTCCALEDSVAWPRPLTGQDSNTQPLSFAGVRNNQGNNLVATLHSILVSMTSRIWTVPVRGQFETVLLEACCLYLAQVRHSEMTPSPVAYSPTHQQNKLKILGDNNIL